MMHYSYDDLLEKYPTIREILLHIPEKQYGLEAISMRADGIERSISYGQLVSDIKALGNILIQSGVKRGDKVGLLSENRIEWPIVYLSVTAIGATIVPLDIFLGPDELPPVINNSDMKCIFTSSLFMEHILSIENQLPEVNKIICFDDHKKSKEQINKVITKKIKSKPENEIIVDVISRQIQYKKPFNSFKYLSFNILISAGNALFSNGVDNYSKAIVEPDDIAAFIPMQGTVFATLSHGGIMANLCSGILRISGQGEYYHEGEKHLGMLPFHHTFPMSGCVFLPLMTSGTIYTINQFKAAEIINAVNKFKIHYLITVPLFIEKIYHHCRENVSSLKSIRQLITGGAPIQKSILKAMDIMGFNILQGYGLTEYSPIVTCNSPKSNRIGSVGFPMDDVKITINNPDENGNGDILVTGPSIMKGYYNMPEKTSSVIDENGWLITGDIGRLDDDGFLLITGRRKKVIVNKGGKNIYPEDIESLLLDSSFITDVFVESRLDEIIGEYSFAYIQVDKKKIEMSENQNKQSYSDKDIRKLIEKEIERVTFMKAPYKVPSRFSITTESLAAIKTEMRKKTFMFKEFYSDEPYQESTGTKTKPKSISKNKQLHKNTNEIYEIVECTSQLITYLINSAMEIAGVNFDIIDKDTHFFEFLSSIELKLISGKIEKDLNIEFNPTVFFEHTTIRRLSEYLVSEYSDQLMLLFDICEKTSPGAEQNPQKELEVCNKVIETLKEKKTAPPTEHHSPINCPVAIVGMSCVFPDSKSSEEYWSHLDAGENCITEIRGDRFDWHQYYGNPLTEKNKTCSKWGGFYNDMDKFDAEFFSISPREAELMDPQQRVILQTTWKALEDAGYTSDKIAKSMCGVFIGVSTWDYSDLINNSIHNADPYASIGNAHSVIANRISYYLDTHGPSETVDAACAGSLFAVHRAVNMIQTGECDFAIAGGVNALITPNLFISFSKAGMLSPDGRCKTFDKNANGYVRGEGAGTIVLKPLDKALEDNNHIYGIIKGISVNHGGRASSLTVPNAAAQTNVLVSAYKKAAVSPDTVSYIEAHGTGTELGDPVEINGLKNAFNQLFDISPGLEKRFNYCGIGSAKTNIGHLEAASGIAGVIKVLLAMKHKKIPASV